MFIDKKDKKYSLKKQCEILGINRATMYYEPREIPQRDQEIMNLLDKEYTKHSFYGARKMKQFLKEKGYLVGRKHIGTLLKKMGLEAVFPKRNLSKPYPGHKIYAYLLKGLKIVRVNQVWSTDITYIRMGQGFAYLVAIIDWYSRRVLSWRLSNTLEADFCVDALNEALSKYGKPEIFNTDQGSQFTSKEFTNKLSDRKVLISMDGRGRAYDNIFIERLWRTVKYEDIYPKGYMTMKEAREGLKEYFKFYNNERYHQSLDYKTPWQVYIKGLKKIVDFKKHENNLLWKENKKREILTGNQQGIIVG